MIGLGKRHGGLYTLQCSDSFTLPSSVLELLSRLPYFLCNKSVNICNLDSCHAVATSNNPVILTLVMLLLLQIMLLDCGIIDWVTFLHKD